MSKPTTINELLEDTFDAFQDVEDALAHSQKKADFVFHMTDWVDDLEKIAELFKDPSKLDRKASRQFIFGFLAHVIPHLNAAGRLLIGEVSDPFGKKDCGDSRSAASPSDHSRRLPEDPDLPN
jgi:hypothetical protein